MKLDEFWVGGWMIRMFFFYFNFFFHAKIYFLFLRSVEFKTFDCKFRYFYIHIHCKDIVVKQFFFWLTKIWFNHSGLIHKFEYCFKRISTNQLKSFMEDFKAKSGCFEWFCPFFKVLLKIDNFPPFQMSGRLLWTNDKTIESKMQPMFYKQFFLFDQNIFFKYIFHVFLYLLAKYKNNEWIQGEPTSLNFYCKFFFNSRNNIKTSF